MPKKHISIESVKKWFKTINWKKAFFIFFAIGFLCIGAGLIWAATIKLPDVSTFEARKIANSSKITDRTGEIVLYDINQGVRRTEVPLDQMSPSIRNAIVAIEDAHFYTHKGIRPTSIIRAIFANLTPGGNTQGGSTLTQQIIKNTLLTSDKTVVRKFKEWVLALKLERHFTKDQILQIYLNDAPFGGTIYGVEEASQSFFTKSALDLTVAESAYLAAIMPAPTYYSPFGRHKDKLDERKELVLSKMKQHGYINDAEYEAARAEVITFSVNASNSIKAPHFVFYILDYLEQKYGKEVMESGGYVIKTTLDYEMQQKAEKTVADYAAKNLKQFNASNSALVAIDPTTGHILSMVGSKDYFAKDIDGAYNIATAERQPGSSFKPFVYATAFAKGYTPETVLFDVPTEFSTSCPAITVGVSDNTDKNCYHPSNFDSKFKGPIQLRNALAESRNIPAVKLLYLVGLDSAIETAHNLGISTLNRRQDYGLSLVLGGGEVKLLDMVGAYGTLANSGVRNPTTGIFSITDRTGKVIEEFEPDPIEVLDRNAALTLNSVLSDPVARTPTFGSSITIPGVAVKTGTTNDERDAWIVGYTPSLAVGVWSGNNDNKSMRSGGAAVSGPLWKDFMQQILTETPAPTFEEPLPDPDYDSLKPILRGIWNTTSTVDIDMTTGLPATSETPVEFRTETTIPSVQSILYWIDKENPRGPSPTNPSKDPEFRLWNPSVQAWWITNQGGVVVPNPLSAPSSLISIKGLDDVMSTTRESTVRITTSSPSALTSVDIFVDNTYITTLSNPFRFTFTSSQYNLKPGTHTMRAVGTNTLGSKSSTQETFEVR